MGMNEEFLKKAISVASYHKKEGTTSSYYWQEGTKLLPNRLSISKESITKVQRKGRNLQKISGQCVGNFKKTEESPLKICKPFVLRTQIWQVEDYLQFIGYGTIGITGEDGRIIDTGDLMLFYADDADWQTIRILIFKGMGNNPDNMNAAMRYASSIISIHEEGAASQQPLQVDIK